MTHIDTLRELAALASPLPWEKSSADVPYSAKAALQGALSPDVVVRLLDAAQAGRGLLDAYARADEDDCPLQEAASIVRDATAALRAALDALEKMDGQHQQEKTG